MEKKEIFQQTRLNSLREHKEKIAAKTAERVNALARPGDKKLSAMDAMHSEALGINEALDDIKKEDAEKK